MLDGLLIRKPWSNKILDGEKIWEIRGKRTEKRGTIAVIQSGSGKVMGTCELTDVVGPLSKDEFINTQNLHLTPKSEIKQGLPYERTYAWVMKNPKRLKTPVPYKHHNGAVTWVKLDENVEKTVQTTGLKANLDYFL